MKKVRLAPKISAATKSRMNQSLEQAQLFFLETFESWLSHHLAQMQGAQGLPEVLFQSQKYSLLTGGKRFRPFLAYLVHGLFSQDLEKIKSYCLALEMVHTYSLIHDDLPCMDNDDFRRGKPSNHKMFSEDIALLAGDGLLTDVFFLLSNDSTSDASTRVRVISLLAGKIGSQGMVGGQTLDMKITANVTLKQLQTIHTLKTASLIEAAAVGGGLYGQANREQLQCLSEFGHCLGMAFQIQDDRLDSRDKDQDFKSYVHVLGAEETQKELNQYSERARASLKRLNMQTETLEQLIDYNLNRSH